MSVITTLCNTGDFRQPFVRIELAYARNAAAKTPATMEAKETPIAAAPLPCEEPPVGLGPLEEPPEVREVAPAPEDAVAPLVEAVAEPLPLAVGAAPGAETASVKSAEEAVFTQLLVAGAAGE